MVLSLSIVMQRRGRGLVPGARRQSEARRGILRLDLVAGPRRLGGRRRRGRHRLPSLGRPAERQRRPLSGRGRWIPSRSFLFINRRLAVSFACLGSASKAQAFCFRNGPPLLFFCYIFLFYLAGRQADGAPAFPPARAPCQQERRRGVARPSRSALLAVLRRLSTRCAALGLRSRRRRRSLSELGAVCLCAPFLIRVHFLSFVLVFFSLPAFSRSLPYRRRRSERRHRTSVFYWSTWETWPGFFFSHLPPTPMYRKSIKLE